MSHSKKLKFAVDFDGTLIDDDRYPAMGEWLPGAQAFLRYLCDLGEVTIYSCRASELHHGTESVRPFLQIWQDINAIRTMLDKASFHQVKIFSGKGKPGADYYIDNKAIEFRGSFDEVLKKIEKPKDNTVVLAQYLNESITAKVRQFSSGATRNVDDTKIDPEAALSPLVIQRYCEFKVSHRKQADGSVRPDDGWQKGIPLDSYMKSQQRHNLDAWLLHRGWDGVYSDDMEETLCAIIFNASGYLHELLAAKRKEEAA